uniref:Uncharacterized protein n=1 Tax=Ditylenchus dipsaci TaxID=166011 RepID=A0A915ETW8_9BILA
MSFNFIRFHEICKDPFGMKNALQQWHLIPEEGQYFCPKCNIGILQLASHPSQPDGFRLNNASACRRQAGVYKGSALGPNNVPPRGGFLLN